MKKFEVTLTGHYEKTISVYADSPEQAAEKVQIILFDTDFIDFSDEDFAYGEADIKEADEARCAENVCMRTRIKNTSYQALNLVIQNGSGNQIRLLGDAPNTP